MSEEGRLKQPDVDEPFEFAVQAIQGAQARNVEFPLDVAMARTDVHVRAALRGTFDLSPEDSFMRQAYAEVARRQREASLGHRFARSIGGVASNLQEIFKRQKG